MENQNRNRKAPNRSRLSDNELLEKIRKERSERPSEFTQSSCASAKPTMAFCMSSANEVIAKWL
ncbi:MAG: hypothetical protein HDS84_01410 [Bacteroidales bacterium]|nr:hypothetical protein [Bacteroidales bacterium]